MNVLKYTMLLLSLSVPVVGGAWLGHEIASLKKNLTVEEHVLIIVACAVTQSVFLVEMVT